MRHEFIPQSFLFLRHGYSTETLKKDLLAGITVGVISLPLAMAFAMASGVDPTRGLVTAIIAGFLISALGGSRVQIGGPTGAFVVLIYDIFSRTGYPGLAISTSIGGILLILFGLFRLGSWIKYVPHPLVTGFTTGIAVLLFTSQIKDFLGLPLRSLPQDFIHKWQAYYQAWPSAHLPSVWVGVGTLLFIILVRRFIPRIPWGIAAVVMATLACYLWNVPVETIHSRFGQIPHFLPLPSLPSLDIPAEHLNMIVRDGVAIALLGGIESLLSAVIADGMLGSRHRSNCELIAHGIGNLGSVLFGGMPATGAIARTATNVKTGATTPVAGMVHALTVLLIVLFLAPAASQIPLPVLAAISIMIAWTMSELSRFISLLRAPAGEVAILLTAFILTVFVDITLAILLGMVLSSFLFMKRMSESVKAVAIKPLLEEKTQEHLLTQNVPSWVEVYEIQGPFFFGTADLLKDVLVNMRPTPKAFVLRLRHVTFIDLSGAHALQELERRCLSEGVELILTEVPSSTQKLLKKMRFSLGAHAMFSTLREALHYSYKYDGGR